MTFGRKSNNNPLPRHFQWNRSSPNAARGRTRADRHQLRGRPQPLDWLFWDKKAMHDAPGDYTQATVYHWTHWNALSMASFILAERRLLHKRGAPKFLQSRQSFTPSAQSRYLYHVPDDQMSQASPATGRRCLNLIKWLTIDPRFEVWLALGRGACVRGDRAFAVP